MCHFLYMICFSVIFFFKQKTAYDMRISDWSSDVCSSDLIRLAEIPLHRFQQSASRHCESRIGGLHNGWPLPSWEKNMASLSRLLLERELRAAADPRHGRNAPRFPKDGASALERRRPRPALLRSEEHTSELQSLMRH